jgi:hypothetical protein
VTTLIEFLRARIDEDEAAALAAVDPECPGTHWQWVTTETDTPVAHGDLDEAQEHQKVALRTVEHVDYPPETGYGSLPAFLIVYTEEVHAGAGEHVTRHDPARVLSEVTAKRALLEDINAEKHLVVDGDPYFTCNAATEERDGGESWAREKWGTACGCGRDDRVERRLKLLAAPYSDHPEFRKEWAV